jgi:8-oxo-dGTP pyrophosphatase MutT (NUDIX family)
MAAPETKSCGFLLVRGNPVRSFLLMQHPTRWDLPKGHVSPGETELECAFRELAEETGIAPEDVEIDDGFRFTTQYHVTYKKKFDGRPCQKTLVILLARLKRDVKLVLTEHEGYRWFDWNPPHRIQERTIDPLLAEVEKHLADTASSGIR